jgi:hypothetical protein
LNPNPSKREPIQEEPAIPIKGHQVHFADEIEEIKIFNLNPEILADPIKIPNSEPNL